MRWTDKTGPRHRVNGAFTVCGLAIPDDDYTEERLYETLSCKECQAFPVVRAKDVCNCDQALAYRFALQRIIDTIEESIGCFEGSFEAEHYQDLSDIATKILDHPGAVK